MTGAVVAVVAHPDDESLIAGGTLVMAGAAGAETGVVALTRGEHGPVAGSALREAERLGSVRERELQAAAACLGARWVTCMRHPDGELEGSDQRAIAEELAEVLEAHQPSAVLTFGEDGLYWHPDHIAARAIADIAVDLLEQGGAGPVWLYEAVWPSNLVTRLVASARERGLPTDMWGIEPEAFGSAAGGRMIALDVRSVLDRKLSALRAHRTQIGRDHLLAALPDDLAQQFLGVERWRVSRPSRAGLGAIGRLAAGDG